MTDSIATINSRHVYAGETQVSVRGMRGKFTVMSITHNTAGDMIVNCVGGKAGHTMMRSFYADRVKTVHNRPKEVE